MVVRNAPKPVRPWEVGGELGHSAARLTRYRVWREGQVRRHLELAACGCSVLGAAAAAVLGAALDIGILTTIAGAAGSFTVLFGVGRWLIELHEQHHAGGRAGVRSSIAWVARTTAVKQLPAPALVTEPWCHERAIARFLSRLPSGSRETVTKLAEDFDGTCGELVACALLLEAGGLPPRRRSGLGACFGRTRSALR